MTVHITDQYDPSQAYAYQSEPSDFQPYSQQAEQAYASRNEPNAQYQLPETYQWQPHEYGTPLVQWRSETERDLRAIEVENDLLESVRRQNFFDQRGKTPMERYGLDSPTVGQQPSDKARTSSQRISKKSSKPKSKRSHSLCCF
ncbi:hypothetical protein EG328_000003 [Venturia inaequalis]|uniref:Uncharacterized protein n=1 Tax=Venturia inaequalis TaxID=5025 RepID=A0A8H3USB4_VENIN|nr:hypothetical protein EG327_008190 [Venturia inaequalis]KAE9989072.1 hypothetical protein EG328_000003 [Venturia inaequalis]RDI89687.1 hypothetical protein Vi05172_g94 [Venturia inaequalis]